MVLLRAITVVGAALVVLAAGPDVLAFRVSVVLSGSMEPALPLGSLVLSLPANADSLAPSDIITFARPDRLTVEVTHRIVAVERGVYGAAFVTKGDANNAPDGWRVPAEPGLQRAVFVVPYAGYVTVVLRSFPARLLLALLLTVLGIGLLREAWRARRRSLGSLRARPA